MNSKKKMIIAISAFAMVILAAVVAVVAVLAAQQVTVKSSFTVTYSVDDIFGFAKASYKLEGDSSYTEWLTETEFDDTLVSGPTLTDPDINFTKSQRYVIIKFEFKKTSASVENFTAKLNYSATDTTNITVTYGTSEDAISSAAKATMFDATINSTSYHTFFVKIALTNNDTTVDASFAGEFNWLLGNIES